jgi:hypothetical protein
MFMGFLRQGCEVGTTDRAGGVLQQDLPQSIEMMFII